MPVRILDINDHYRLLVIVNTFEDMKREKFRDSKKRPRSERRNGEAETKGPARREPGSGCHVLEKSSFHSACQGFTIHSFSNIFNSVKIFLTFIFL